MTQVKSFRKNYGRCRRKYIISHIDQHLTRRHLNMKTPPTPHTPHPHTPTPHTPGCEQYIIHIKPLQCRFRLKSGIQQNGVSRFSDARRDTLSYLRAFTLATTLVYVDMHAIYRSHTKFEWVSRSIVMWCCIIHHGNDSSSIYSGGFGAISMGSSST